MERLASVRSLVAKYQRGILSESEFVNEFLRILTRDSHNLDVIHAVQEFPVEALNELSAKIKSLTENNYYEHQLYFGDTRTEEEKHRDAVAMQPGYQRICEKLRELGLT